MSRSEIKYTEITDDIKRRQNELDKNKSGYLSGFIPLILTLVLIGLLYLMGII